MSQAPSQVRHNSAQNRFELEVEGHTAVAYYRMVDGVMHFVHTEVDPALEGRGIGSRLVHGALEQARALGAKVRPRCSFVGHYINRHPEFADLVA